MVEVDGNKVIDMPYSAVMDILLVSEAQCTRPLTAHFIYYIRSPNTPIRKPSTISVHIAPPRLGRCFESVAGPVYPMVCCRSFCMTINTSDCLFFCFFKKMSYLLHSNLKASGNTVKFVLATSSDVDAYMANPSGAGEEASINELLAATAPGYSVRLQTQDSSSI